MRRISNEEIMNIRNKVNSVDIISEYLPLVQRGKNFFALCPFHDDHNPSMSISPEKQIFTCFVCGASGNVFTFLMEYEHLSFIEAVKLVGEKVGIKLDIKTGLKIEKDDIYSRYYQIYDLTNKYYQNNLNTVNGKKARDYLAQRSFSDEIIREFGIGLADSGNKVYKMLKSNGYSDEELLDIGICSSSEKGIHDTFINRIMFPIWNLNGQVVAFSGRIYNNEDVSKYVNSKESKIFKKGKILYNYHRAKAEIRKEKKVIVVEGFIDVIALYKIGIKNVVATMGTAITSDQASLIKKLSLDVILCFDGDSAGEKASISAAEELIKIALIPRIVRLEDNLDPDDYINKKGVDKFISNLENPLSYLDFKIDTYKKEINLNNSEDISRYINLVIKELLIIKDPIIREITLKRINDETGVSFDTLNNILKKQLNISSKTIKPKEQTKEVKRSKNKYEKAEQSLLYYMFKSKEVINIFDSNNCILPSQKYRYLVNELFSFYRKYNTLNIADFIAFLGEKKELVEVMGEILKLDLPEKYTEEEIYDYVEVLNQVAVEQEIKRLNKFFKEENDPLKKAEIANQIAILRKGSDSNG